MITIFTFPINRPVFEFVSNSTESPAILKSARCIVVRSFELKMRVFKSSTDVLMSILQVRLILRRVGRNFEMLKADVFLVNPVRRSRFEFSP